MTLQNLQVCPKDGPLTLAVYIHIVKAVGTIGKMCTSASGLSVESSQLPRKD